jgi:hypothetical protein
MKAYIGTMRCFWRRGRAFLLQRKIIPELQSAAAALSDEREVTLSTTDDVAAAAQPDKRLPYIRA